MALPRRGPSWRGQFLYVAQRRDTGELKVGITHDIRMRLTAFGYVHLVAWWHIRRRDWRSKYGWTRELWSARLAEIDLHARLNPWLVKGEWFRGDDDALLVIGTLRRDRRYPAPIGSARNAPSAPKKRRAWLASFYAARSCGRSLKASAAQAERDAHITATLASLRQQIRNLSHAGHRLSRALRDALEAA